MALFGEGRGFRLLIAFSVVVVVLTLAARGLDIKPPLLTLATTADGTVTPIACRPDFSAGLVNIRTRLSQELADNFPLAAVVQITSQDGRVLAQFTQPHVDHWSGGRGQIAIQGPLLLADRDLWSEVSVTCKLLRGDFTLLGWVGTYHHPHQVLRDLRYLDDTQGHGTHAH